ncbi:lipopolysaccharide biosynthesis protein [Jiangella muralis]|uniref:lipopolysaccharide biosynthesis protein n=1 Tax=Jiangella muralis TaxID=702383 RepID=UPI0009FB4458|nr:lipopolysaccharide biosynthesis protein [Jiangella muralis]
MSTGLADAGLERSATSGKKVGHGLKWTMVGEWLGYVLQIITIAILSRQLTPEIFGVMAMALTLTVIVDQLRSLGLSQAVIQREDLTWPQVNALFWINAAFGVLLAGVVAATGPLLAAFYDEPQLTEICVVLGVSYLFAGLATQHGALLNRSMDFKKLASRNMIARFVSSLAAIAAAFAGLGVWALVLQQVLYVVLSAVFVWLAADMRFTRPAPLRDTLHLVWFGSQVMLSNLLHSISRQADNIIIGRVLGAGALGLYTRAYALLTLPLRQIKNPISAVMVPTLSALQGEPRRYRRAYSRAINGLAHAGMPAVIVLAVAAPQVIEVFLGSQWTQAATIFQLLALTSLIQLISTTAGWLFVTFGRGAAAATWAAVNAVGTIGAFLIGVQWGVEGVAAAYTISQVVLTWPGFIVACRNTPVRPADALVAVLRPLAVSAAVLAAAAGMQYVLPESWPAPTGLILILVAAGLAWLAALIAWPRARDEVVDLYLTIRGRKVRHDRQPPRHRRTSRLQRRTPPRTDHRVDPGAGPRRLRADRVGQRVHGPDRADRRRVHAS